MEPWLRSSGGLRHCTTSKRSRPNYLDIAPDFAPLFVAGAFETAARLGEFPRLGRIVPEIGDEAIREVIYRQYRIIYIVIGDTAEVLTVYPSARQFGGLG